MVSLPRLHLSPFSKTFEYTPSPIADGGTTLDFSSGLPLFAAAEPNRPSKFTEARPTPGWIPKGDGKVTVP